MKSAPRQFTLGHVLSVIAVYAVGFGIAATILPLLQFALAAAVVTLFAVVDLWLAQSKKDAPPFAAKVAVFLGHYSTAFALATVACFAVFIYQPFPQADTPAIEVQTTPAFEFIEPAVRAVFILFLYTAAFVIFSTAGFVASAVSMLLCRRFSWRTVVLLVCDLPGTLLLAIYVLAAVWESLAE